MGVAWKNFRDSFPAVELYTGDENVVSFPKNSTLESPTNIFSGEGNYNVEMIVFYIRHTFLDGIGIYFIQLFNADEKLTTIKLVKE